MGRSIHIIAAVACLVAAPATARYGDVTFTAQTRFESNMRLELNQQKSLLFPTALRRDVAGADKTKLDNLISNSKPRRKTGRGTVHDQDTTGFDGIWVAKDDPYYLATFQDTEDQLLTAVDLKGAETMNHAGTIARARDMAFLYGFYGDMITGKSGTTLNAFPAGNIVPATLQPDGTTGAATGMNVAKVRRARRILARNFVDMSQTFYLVLTSVQVEELTQDAKAIDRDYADSVKPVWSADGKHLISIAGFMIIEMELSNPLYDTAATLTFDAVNSYRQCPFYTADGMVAAMWEELFTRVAEDDQRHFGFQVYSRTDLVCSRTDNNRCGYIQSKE
jgi:hypothetical protein